MTDPKWPEGDPAAEYLRALTQIERFEGIREAARRLLFCSEPRVRAIAQSLEGAMMADRLGDWAREVGFAARGGARPSEILVTHRRDVLLRKAAASDRYRGLTANRVAVMLAGDLAEFERGPFRQYWADCRLPAVDPEASFHQLLVGRIDGMWDLPERRQLADVLRDG